MIDLHCHLHFGCDDGPKAADDAIDLAKALVDAGVTKVACTSHVRSDKGWFNTLAEQQQLFDKLDDAIGSSGVPLERTRGAEHYLDETLFSTPLVDRVVPYGESKTLLIELPYQGEPPGLMELLFRIRTQGYYVVLAHLERYPYVVEHEDKIEQMLNAGYLIQVNLGSLAGAYSRQHKKAAKKLVEKGHAAIAAGDCHRAADVKPMIVKGRKVLAKLVGEDGAERMLTERPQQILDGAPPEKVWP